MFAQSYRRTNGEGKDNLAREGGRADSKRKEGEKEKERETEKERERETERAPEREKEGEIQRDFSKIKTKKAHCYFGDDLRLKSSLRE